MLARCLPRQPYRRRHPTQVDRLERELTVPTAQP